jgi:hypothetical protein
VRRIDERTAHWIGRLGYLTYGVVQLVLAALIIQIAWGRGGEEASTSGAVATLAGQPLGLVLVWVVAVGMALLSVWQLTVAFSANEGAWDTAAAVMSGLAYGVVSVIGFRFALGSGGGGDSDQRAEQAAATAFDLPGGRWIVAAVGLGIAAVGLRHVYKGATSGFTDDLDTEAVEGRWAGAVLWLGRVGYAGRGVAYVVVGGLIVAAGATRDPDQAGGLDEALSRVREQPAGPGVLSLVAVGFAAYGVFCFVRARYEKE